METLTRIIAQVTAERLRCVAAVANRTSDPVAGADQATRLLQTAGRLSGGQAERQMRLATALADPGLKATAGALAAGRISLDQAEALAQSPRSHPELIASAQEALVDHASQCDDQTFRQLLADRRHTVDPGAEQARAQRQYAARGIALSTLGDGMGRVHGLVDPAGFAVLRSALDALAGPDPASVPDELRRTPAQRNADALGGVGPAGVGPQRRSAFGGRVAADRDGVCHPETLTEQPGTPAARLDWVGTICGATARRIACDADVVRRGVTQGGRTVWVDVHRYPSPAQRLAVIERDRVCRFRYPDGVRCARPWQWCEVHHVEHHGDGGPTVLANLSLLCTVHHHAVHEGGWMVTGDADARWCFIRRRAGPTRPLHVPHEPRSGRHRQPALRSPLRSCLLPNLVVAVTVVIVTRRNWSSLNETEQPAPPCLGLNKANLVIRRRGLLIYERDERRLTRYNADILAHLDIQIMSAGR